MKLGGLDISTVKLGASQVQAIYQGPNLVWQNAPVATAATGVGQTSFTANWEAYSGAAYYLLDVSESSDFSTFIYQNQIVEAPTTSYVVIGVESNTTYYYRVRASTEALPLLLNDYPNAAAAYSLRLLDNTYTGSAIRVRRASDNTEQDIGFVSGELDTATLTTFCSGTDGFVKTWYDQSGNGYDASQTIAANQPQIVSSGSVILENGKPALQFDGSNYRFDLPTIGFNMNAISIIALSKSDSSTSNGVIFSNPDNERIYAGLIISSVEYFGYNDAATKFNLGSANTNQSLKELYAGSSTVNAYINANASTAVSSVSTSVTGNNLSIGSYIKGASIGSFYDGTNQEIIMYTSDQSSNRTGIETNINDFYSIY